LLRRSGDWGGKGRTSLFRPRRKGRLKEVKWEKAKERDVSVDRKKIQREGHEGGRGPSGGRKKLIGRRV